MVTPRRSLAIPGECLASTTELVVELPLSMFAGVALELTLLLEGLNESLRLRPRTGPMLVLTLLESTSLSKAIAKKDPDGTSSIGFALGRNQVEYVRAVLLRAYRDQMAEVNHVHVEGDLEGALFDLTIMFEEFRTPMSPEEAAKCMAD